MRKLNHFIQQSFDSVLIRHSGVSGNTEALKAVALCPPDCLLHQFRRRSQLTPACVSDLHRSCPRSVDPPGLSLSPGDGAQLHCATTSCFVFVYAQLLLAWRRYHLAYSP